MDGFLTNDDLTVKNSSNDIALQSEMSIDDVRGLIADDMKKVNALIQKKLHSEVPLIDQLGHYIVNSGGKRLRPALVLLSAGVFSYQGKKHLNLAAIVEFIHTATLLHDDVVDASLMRRGRATAINAGAMKPAYWSATSYIPEPFR